MTKRTDNIISAVIGSLIVIFAPILAGTLLMCFTDLTWVYLNPLEWSQFGRFLSGAWVLCIGTFCAIHSVEWIQKNS